MIRFYGTRQSRDISPSRNGVYYYPAKIRYYTYDRLLEETRASGYRLPCHCPICEKFQTELNAEANNYFNTFRRIRDVFYKSMENKMLREVTIPFLTLEINRQSGSYVRLASCSNSDSIIRSYPNSIKRARTTKVPVGRS